MIGARHIGGGEGGQVRPVEAENGRAGAGLYQRAEGRVNPARVGRHADIVEALAFGEDNGIDGAGVLPVRLGQPGGGVQADQVNGVGHDAGHEHVGAVHVDAVALVGPGVQVAPILERRKILGDFDHPDIVIPRVVDGGNGVDITLRVEIQLAGALVAGYGVGRD